MAQFGNQRAPFALARMLISGPNAMRHAAFAATLHRHSRPLGLSFDERWVQPV
jgi:hypothetical protein